MASVAKVSDCSRPRMLEMKEAVLPERMPSSRSVAGSSALASSVPAPTRPAQYSRKVCVLASSGAGGAMVFEVLRFPGEAAVTQAET